MTNLTGSRQRFLSFLLVISLIVVSVNGAPALGQRRSSQQAAANNRPRLVLLIAVDQFRYDYLERFGDLFGPNGLRRLMNDGASWVNANYDHMPTYTAPGHATLMSGAYPAETGIVANEWPDRETGKKVTSVSDSTTRLLAGGPNEEGSSPRRMMASTLGDELRLATNDRAKVVGISLKDRSAILPAGRHANAAYWFSARSGNFVSSDYYFAHLPKWVEDFNASHPANEYFGKLWERLLPSAEYEKRAGPDSPPWENIGNVRGDTNAFPHKITGGASAAGPDFYSALEYSPFSNDLLVSFTKQAIVNEQLGQDEFTDLLAISFSADDYVGHRYGPYSQEVMDVTLRVDQQIAALLDFVDSRVGLRNTIVILSADHGVAPIPEHATAIGLSGGRVNSTQAVAKVKAALTARYNPSGKTPDPTADYILKYDDAGRMRDGMINANLYFNLAALNRDGVNLEEIQRVSAAALMTVPGIARCFTRDQLLRGAVSSTDAIERRVLHGFYPQRSGDVIVVTDAFKYFIESEITATHGSPYTYDTHVPQIIMGGRLKGGKYFQAAAPTDIAPTVAAVLGIQPPSNSVGRVLIEAIQ